MITCDQSCAGCGKNPAEITTCDKCGYKSGAPRSPVALRFPCLLNDKFVVGRVLGKPGGFGVTYLGWDTVLQTRVAIKEYLPSSIATRDAETSMVIPNTTTESATFNEGKGEFLEEARTLVQFDHPNIVRVREYFEQNGTAYIVMEYYQGMSLAEYLRTQGPVSERFAMKVMVPLLRGLESMHDKGFMHRDIKPPNIYLTKSGKPVLLDFGSARMNLGGRTATLSVVLTRGYAPVEQYLSKGSHQGPWTDVYACGITLYYMVTMRPPPDALERREADELEPLHALAPHLSKAFCDAVDRAVAINPWDRPRDARAFLDLLADVKQGTRTRKRQGDEPDDGESQSIVAWPAQPHSQETTLVLPDRPMTGATEGPQGTSFRVTAPGPSASAPASPTPATGQSASADGIELFVRTPVAAVHKGRAQPPKRVASAKKDAGNWPLLSLILAILVVIFGVQNLRDHRPQVVEAPPSEPPTPSLPSPTPPPPIAGPSEPVAVQQPPPPCADLARGDPCIVDASGQLRQGVCADIGGRLVCMITATDTRPADETPTTVDLPTEVRPPLPQPVDPPLEPEPDQPEDITGVPERPLRPLPRSVNEIDPDVLDEVRRNAIKVCKGREVGAACHLVTPYFTVGGQCQRRGPVLACTPDIGRLPVPESLDYGQP